MRQLNFLLIFTVCLALVLFGLENTELVPIQIVPGYIVQGPLSIELIIAMGLGAVLAWLFGAWNQLLRQIDNARDQRALRSKEEQIQTLNQDIETYKAELEKQQKQPLLPEDSSGSEAAA